MKKFLLLFTLPLLIIIVVFAILHARAEERSFGAGEEIARICVDGSCKNLSKTDYRTLKNKYKDKINKGEAFAYDEYKELIQIVDLEAKKNPIVLSKVKNKDLAVEIIKEALK